jgi:signal transduction histidine kinase
MNFQIKKIIFFIILIISVANLNCNKKLLDSLKKEAIVSHDTLKVKYYRDIFSIYNNIDFDSASIYIFKALRLSDSYQLNVEKGKILAGYANMLINKSLYQNAVDTLTDAKNILEKTGEIPYLAFVNDQIALAYQRLDKDADALEYFINAWNTLDSEMIDSLQNLNYSKSNFEKFELQTITAAKIINIDWGLFYFDIDKYDKALKKYYFALELCKWSNDSVRIAACYSNIAMIQEKLKNDDGALEKYRTAYQYAKKSNHHRYLASITNNMANIYSRQNDFENAEKFMLESLEYNKKNLNKSSLINNYVNLGLLYLEVSKFQDAEKYLLKANDMAEETGNLFYLSKANEALYVLYQKQNNYKKSLEHLKSFKTFSDSAAKLNNIEQLQDLEVKYETEAKDKKIEFLEIEKTKNDAIRNYLIAFIVTLIAAIIFAVVMLINRRKINQKLLTTNNELRGSEKELREVNNTKDRFLAIITHDIRNPLSAIINSMSIIHKEFDSFEKEEIIEIIDELETASRNLHQLLNDILSWAKSQTKELKVHRTNVNINMIVEKNINLFAQHAKEKNIEVINEVDNNVYTDFDANMFNTVIRNLYNNALKFTQKNGQIKFTSKISNQNVELCVIDNGVGMSDSRVKNLFQYDKAQTTLGTNQEKGSGFGLILIKELIELNEARIEVESELGKGTTFKLILMKTE